MLALFITGAVLITALSVPFSSSAVQGSANIFESIQKQLNEILAAIQRIQIRIAELFLEEAAQQQATEPVVSAPETSVPTSAPQEIIASVDPTWRYMPVPTTFLGTGLVILYRFSITAGSSEAVISTVPYALEFADISIKDLEVHAFKDDLFSQKAYEINPVGKRRGFVQNNVPVSIDISDKTASLVIPAGETRYFELQGITTGKNVSAFAEISANGMQEVRFE